MDSEQEREIDAKMEVIADEYMVREVLHGNSDSAENLSLVFTYKKTANLVRISENLVRSTDRLKYWTIAIAVLTFVMICTTIVNIVVLIAD